METTLLIVQQIWNGMKVAPNVSFRKCTYFYDYNHLDCRFPVQTVIRPHTLEHQDYRGFAGRIDGGIFKSGDKVKILPSGFTSTIKHIDLNGVTIEEAFAPMSVNITLDDEIDISRGDMIVRENNVPEVSQDLEVLVTWMSQKSSATSNQSCCQAYN